MALAPTTTIAEISALLRGMGEEELADRLDYLASDEDLEPGESPAKAESARGFFEFFTSVESDSKVGLACSPEGWIVGEWRWFPDERGASIWFLNSNRVGFTAYRKNGDFVALDSQSNITTCSTLTAALIQEELFSWRPQHQRPDC